MVLNRLKEAMKPINAHGDDVLIVNTLNYNGRWGVLGPISDDPEDIWDFTVALAADGGADDTRIIGVSRDQIVPLSLQSLTPRQQNVYIQLLSDLGLQAIIAACLDRLHYVTLSHDGFMQIKLTIQAALDAWSKLDDSVQGIFDEWRKLGGPAGTVFGYFEALQNLQCLLLRTPAELEIGE